MAEPTRPDRTAKTPGSVVTQADPTTERRVPAPETWVAAHGDYLYRFALGKVRSPDVAEELVQETLLAAWRGRAGFAGNSSERSWLTAILKRKVIDWVRRRVRDRATAPGPARIKLPCFSGEISQHLNDFVSKNRPRTQESL